MFDYATMLDYKAFNIYWEENINSRSRCDLPTFIKYKDYHNKFYIEANKIIRKQKLKEIYEINRY